MATTEIQLTQIEVGTANQLLCTDSSAAIGEWRTLSGTANRVSISFGAGSVTLSGPQDIATSSSPAFQALTLGSTSSGGLSLKDTQISSHTVTLVAPSTVPANYSITLPNAVPTVVSSLFVSDTSGNASWMKPRLYRQVLSGTLNGSNTIFTFPSAFTAGSEEIFLGGILLNVTTDYTITNSTTVTFVVAPQALQAPVLASYNPS